MANQLFRKLLTEFCAQSSMHGFNHIVAPKRHIFERLIWLTIIILTATAATALILRSYNRFQTDPTVISIDRSRRDWSTPLPATTFCFRNRFDKGKARRVIEETWNKENGSEYQYYEDFLSCLANATFTTIHSCSKFVQDHSLASLNLSQLAQQVNFDLAYISAAAFFSDHIHLEEIKTDMGICYSFNARMSRYFQTREPNGNETLTFSPAVCDNPEKLCYAKIFNLPRSISFFVHTPFDIARITDSISSPLGFDLATTYQALHMQSTSRVQSLKRSQRRCLFYHENPLSGTPFYTYDLCVSECRRALALRLCKCVPFFYKTSVNELQCKTKDIQCLVDNADTLESLIDEKTGEKHSCDCVPNCSSTVYFQTSLTKLEILDFFPQDMTHYQYELEVLPQMQLKRDVLYNAEDLFVAWGGIAAFFLGCSIISGIEVVYFFTIRLLRYCHKNVKNAQIRRRRSIFHKYGTSHTNHPMTLAILELAN